MGAKPAEVVEGTKDERRGTGRSRSVRPALKMPDRAIAAGAWQWDLGAGGWQAMRRLAAYGVCRSEMLRCAACLG